MTVKEQKGSSMPVGFYWHVHHDILVEWCHNYEERASCIRTEKPKHERDIRLRLFRPVKGILPQKVQEAKRAYAEAWLACDEAGIACDKAWLVYDEARLDYDEVWLAYKKAKRAYDEARRAYYNAFVTHRTDIETLHTQECPDCPWNGETIFP